MNTCSRTHARTRSGAAVLLTVACLGAMIPAGADAGSPRRHRSAAPPSVAKGAIRVAVSRPDLHGMLLRAFDAFNAGDLSAADAGYAQVLDTDPRNADARHGRAAVALRSGKFDQATAQYLKAVEVDPRDSVAHAGLAGLRGLADPAAAATRLTHLLATQPGQPALHFALGNLEAAAGNWREASRHFLAARNADPTQPDYLFNVAVSYDQLRQPEQAAQHYRQALAAADKRLPGFDPAQAAVRLRELE